MDSLSMASWLPNIFATTIVQPGLLHSFKDCERVEVFFRVFIVSCRPDCLINVSLARADSILVHFLVSVNVVVSSSLDGVKFGLKNSQRLRVTSLMIIEE